MNYLLNEDEVLHSRFLIFFLSCANQQKFEAKREIEFTKAKKTDKWLHGSRKRHNGEETKKENEDRMFATKEQPSPEDQINQFLGDAAPNLIECQSLYKK